MSFERTSGETGYALAIMMIVLSGLSPLGMLAVMQARLDLLVEQQTRRALETFYTAEAGLEHALADLAEDPRFERLAANPNEGQSGAARGFPFRHSPPEYFPHAPFRYEVIVEPRSTDRVDIVSHGFGPFRASRTVAASVARSALPALPGALYSAAPGVHVLLGDDLSLLGRRSVGREAGTPALAVADAETAAAVSAGLERRGGPGLDPPGVRVRDFPGLEAVTGAAGSSPNAQHLAGDLAGSLGTGVFLRRGALEVADATGSGLLVVDGPLRVRGHLQFSGLVVVLGDVRFDPQSGIAITGGLLQGPNAGLLHLLGRGTIRHDPEALATLESLAPGLLPRRARVTGWQEHG
jgi:hypothetical protein